MQTINEFILENLLEFYSNKYNWKILYCLSKRKLKISIRIVEFTLIHAVELTKKYNLHGVFSNELSNRGKRYFDAFKRFQKFVLRFNNQEIVTNIAQMKFIRIAIRSGVISWLLKNPDNYKKAEKMLREKIKEKKKKHKKSKRHHLFAVSIKDNMVCQTQNKNFVAKKKKNANSRKQRNIEYFFKRKITRGKCSGNFEKILSTRESGCKADLFATGEESSRIFSCA